MSHRAARVQLAVLTQYRTGGTERPVTLTASVPLKLRLPPSAD
ncbi:MAG: hypothetical protein RL653_2123 [Pseudomonadota bacterium]